MPSRADEESVFDYAAAGLRRGDFSRLAPLFTAPSGVESQIAAWVEQGRFNADAAVLNEALACACFLGETTLTEFLLDHGADLLAGAATGLNGFHWAANRGQLGTVRALLARQLPLEIPNSFGGTVLGGTVWAAVHEPRAAHLEIIQALLEAGADVQQAEYPSGDASVDRILRQFGAGAASDA